MSSHRIATCTLCEAACGIIVEVEGDRALSVRGDPDDPMSRGYVCPKVVAMKDLHDDPDRLRTPLVRDGRGELREATWEEALGRAAEGIRRIRRAHGPDAFAVYQGNPSAHNLGLLTVGQLVLRSFGTKNLYSASSSDQVPHMLAAKEMFGNTVLMPVPDLDRTDFFLVVGANPLVSNGSLMTAPDMRRRLRAIRERGGRVVVVDPRRTETADAADEHVFIRPGTDPAFLMALISVVLEEGIARERRPAGHDSGIAALERAAADFRPERVAAFTGIQADTIRRIARQLAASDRAACYGRVGICHQEFGTLAAWLVWALSAVTGNLDREGGNMFATPAVDVPKLAALLGLNSYATFESRVRRMPEVGRELPIATLADEIETSGRGQVRALLTSAGNPALSAPNGERLSRAIASLEHVVCVDAYLNETTRHAHVVLPPVSPLERSHYDVALLGFAVHNHAKFVESPIARASGAKHDWEILLELGLRVRSGESAPGRVARAALARALGRVGPEGLLDVLLRLGPHGAGLLGRRGDRGSPGLTLARLRAAPHGVDLGPLVRRFQGRSGGTGGDFELAPSRFLRELPALTRAMEAERGSGLVLIGRRHLRSNNSWLHNSRALVKGPARCTLLMNEADASEQGLVAGAEVDITSRTGSVRAALEISSEVMPGVVSLPHGWGHSRAGTKLGVASERPGVSVNDLTDDALVDSLTGNAAFSGVPVTVRASPTRLA